MSRMSVLTITRFSAGAPTTGVLVEAVLLCDVCGLPIEGADVDDRHEYHDDGCPNQRWERTKDAEQVQVDCECNNVAHPHCCPACAPHIVLQRRRLVRWYWTGTKRGWSSDSAEARQYADKWRAGAARDRLVKRGLYNVRNSVDVLPVVVAQSDYREFLAAIEALAAPTEAPGDD